eukprot:gene22988-30176_t
MSIDFTLAQRRCLLARGSWCMDFYTQQPLPVPEPIFGSKSCPENCGGLKRGVCDADTGRCSCVAGWRGEGCTQLDKAPCFNQGADKRDLNWTNPTWVWSRCAGTCDDDISMCYCPVGSKYGRVEAPPDSPPGTSAINLGRPLYNCHPGTDEKGGKVAWGIIPYEDLFSKEKGWCEVDKPEFNGHGDCHLGFCMCHEGYYGFECSRRREGVPQSTGEQEGSKPWLAPHVNPVPATHGPSSRPDGRKRPFIYVYDLPPEFNSRLLQTRTERGFWWTYSVEPVLHEAMLLSEHRTLDPDEADFFYVPVYSTCVFELYGKNPRPRWPNMEGAGQGPRPMAASKMMRAAQTGMNVVYDHLPHHQSTSILNHPTPPKSSNIQQPDGC